MRNIADRLDVFYWQTDRAVEPKEAGEIWADRHRYFVDQEIIDKANQLLEDKLTKLMPLDPKAQTNLGNVNSCREGKLESGKEVIIRCHPRGITNGYFYAETTAASTARDVGLPTYRTLAIHEAVDESDYAFQVIEKLPGDAVQRWLEIYPEDESELLYAIGSTMAKLHMVAVDGFGPFDNELAKQRKLQGLHRSYSQALRAGLTFNLDVLQKEGIFTDSQVKQIDSLYRDDNPLLQVDRSILVHNDFADWNLLTDGKRITGILDWDECVGGDAVSDIACWSTFFDPVRLDGMLKGYWSVAAKPVDFEEKFEILRLRYTVSKMTLRIRRYSWEPTEAMKQKIDVGKKHLEVSLRNLGLGA